MEEMWVLENALLDLKQGNQLWGFLVLGKRLHSRTFMKCIESSVILVAKDLIYK